MSNGLRVFARKSCPFNPSRILLYQPGNAGNYDVKVYTGELAAPTASFRRFEFQQAGPLRKVKFSFVPKTTGVHYIYSYASYAKSPQIIDGLDIGIGTKGKQLIPLLHSDHFRNSQNGSGYNILIQHCANRILNENDPDNNYALRAGAYTFVVKWHPGGCLRGYF